ncbi:MAG: hypothetical protein LBG97_05410 [Coriobacteriales bacterium]|jgi:hypothetical protein|nr:hypothetical protein [Coriobacteriales bacterium]
MTLEQTQQVLGMLNSGTYLCLALMIVCFIISILLFWRFNVLRIIKERTGISGRQAAKLFNQRNTKDKTFSTDSAVAFTASSAINATESSEKTIALINSNIVTNTEDAENMSDTCDVMKSSKDFLLIREVLVVHTDARIEGLL